MRGLLSGLSLGIGFSCDRRQCLDQFFFNVVIISNHVGVVYYGVQLIVSNVELVRGSKVKRVLSPISTCWKNGNQSL